MAVVSIDFFIWDIVYFVHVDVDKNSD